MNFVALILFTCAIFNGVIGQEDRRGEDDSAYYSAEGGRSLYNPEMAVLPPDLLRCYTDRRLWDRFSRSPSSVDSLVSLLRKLELHPSLRNWTPGRLAAAVVHRFRFDGLQYDRCVDTTTGAPPIRVDMQVEYPKMALVMQLISAAPQDIPDEALTQREKCSLHWMLSYSVNTTFRADELFWTTDYENSNTGRRPQSSSSHQNLPNRHHQHQGSYEDYNNWAVHPPYGSLSSTYRRPYANAGIACDDNVPKSRAPWETGVVWSPSGPLAAGTMLAGLAAGLQPQSVSWPAGQIDNGWGASLAGDVAQTALLKRKDEPYVGPDGYFNSTLCPSEFYLRMRQDGYASYSHLTVAEINAGIDGLLMAEFSNEWQRRSELTLSQVVDLYYNSQLGHIRGTPSGPDLNACDRYKNYAEHVSSSRLRSEAFVFGTELKSIMIMPVGEEALTTAIIAAIEKLNAEIRLLDSSLSSFGPCALERRNAEDFTDDDGYEGLPIDYKLVSSGIADVGIIWDTSIFTWEEQYFLKQVTAGLVSELDVWATGFREHGASDDVYVGGGSVADVSDGRYAREIASTARYYFNKADMACGILKEFVPMTGDLDPELTLNVVGSKIAERQHQREISDASTNLGRSAVLVLFMFNRPDSGTEDELYDAVYSLRRTHPGVRLLIVTRNAPQSVFAPYVLHPQFDVVLLSQYGQELLAEANGRAIARRIAQIKYSDCKDPDDPTFGEKTSEEVLYLLPNTQRFLEVAPKYLIDSEQLQITFAVAYNTAKICWSRASPEEQSLGGWDDPTFSKGEECDTASTSSASESRITFHWRDPCKGQSVTRCKPIYFRLEGINSGGLHCQTNEFFPCRTATSAQVTVSHLGMTCAGSTAIVAWIALIAGIMAIATLR